MKWNPYQSYTWTNAQVKRWHAVNGATAFYDGKSWTMQASRLAGGMYSVVFVEVLFLKPNQPAKGNENGKP